MPTFFRNPTAVRALGRSHRFTCMTIRIAITATLISASVLGMGCAQVDPRPDFRETSRRTAERNSSSDAYDPAAEAVIHQKVRALLDGGLTIDEAVGVALLNNPAFQAEFLTIGASRADVVQSGLLSNPTLFFSVRFPEAGGRSSINFSFAQQLVDLWQIPVRKRVAEADLERTIATVLDRGVQLAAEVRSQCFQVLAFERAEQIAMENLELTRQVLKLAQVRLDAGDTDPIDVNLVSSHAFEVEQILIAIRRDRRTAELSLATMLGLVRWPDTWELHGKLEGERVASLGIDDLVSFALQERFDVQIVSSQVDSAEGQLEREYLEIFPNLTLGLEAERPDRRALPGRKILADTARASVAAGKPTAPTIESRGQRDLLRRQIVDSLLGPSLQITLPIWDQNQAQIAKTRYAVVQLRKMHDSVQDRVTREVSQAYIAASAADELVELLKTKALPRARENVEIIRRQYENGEQSILFLLESQEFLLQQSRAYVNALRDSALASAELTRALGGKRPPEATGQAATTQPSNHQESSDALHNR